MLIPSIFKIGNKVRLNKNAFKAFETATVGSSRVKAIMLRECNTPLITLTTTLADASKLDEGWLELEPVISLKQIYIK